MAAVALIGHDSRIGRAIASALTQDGHDVVPLSADDLTGPDRARDEVALVVHAAPADDAARVREVVRAAIARGMHHLDVVTDAAHARVVDDTLSAAAVEARVSVLPCAGPDLVPGEALALLAAGAVTDPTQLHLSFAVPSPGGLVGSLTPGGRRAWAAVRETPGEVLDAGRLLPERIGEARRLAWFPRPVGPCHALGVPGHLAWAVPRQVAAIRTVRTYVAVPGWRAEWVQFAGAAARWAPAQRWLAWPLQRGGRRDPQGLAEVRWACVGEALGRGGEVARAWANGHDPLGVTAAGVAELATAVLAGGAPVGVLSPASVVAPGHLLDRLAQRVDLRWSVVRPGGDRPF